MSRKKRPYKSVADMPRVMRVVCECLVADRYRHEHWNTANIAHKLGVKPHTVQMHISRAMKAVGVDDRGALTEWCWRGRYIRPVSSAAPMAHVSVRGTDNQMVEVWLASAIDAIRASYPIRFVEEAFSMAQCEEFKRAVISKANPVEHVRKEFNQLAPPRGQEPALVAYDLTQSPELSEEQREAERQLAADRKAAGLPPERVYAPRPR
jgi:hypothetical protein